MPKRSPDAVREILRDFPIFTQPTASPRASIEPQSDVDQVLAPAEEPSESDGSTATVEATEAERRRQMLINSYSRWARNRGRHRRRDQGRTGGGAPMSFGALMSGGGTAILGTDCPATTMKDRKGAAPSARALVVASNNRTGTIWRNASELRPERWSQGGDSDCAREFLSAGAASRQLLLSRSLRRARIFLPGRRSYDVPRGPSLVRATVPLHQPPRSSFGASSPHSSVMPCAPPGETGAPADHTDITERSLEVAKRASTIVARSCSFDTGADVVTSAEPRGATLKNKPAQQIPPAQRKSASKEPSQRVPAAGTAPRRQETSDRRIKRDGLGPALINILSTRPVVDSGRSSVSTPSRENPFDGVGTAITGSAGGDRSHRSSCRNVVVWTGPTNLAGRIEEREGYRSVPTVPEPLEARPEKNGGALHFTGRNGAENKGSGEVREEEEMIVRAPPRRRSGTIEGGARKDVWSSAYRMKGSAVVESTLETHSNHNGMEQQHQIVPFTETGAEAEAKPATERSQEGTVAIFYPATTLCTARMVGELKNQVGSGCDGGGDNDVRTLVLWNKHARAYDAEILHADHSMDLISRESQPVLGADGIQRAFDTLVSDRSEGECIHGNNRMARYDATDSFVKETRCGRTPEERGELEERGTGGTGGTGGAETHLVPAVWRRDGRRRWESSSYRGAGVLAVTCSRAPDPVGAAAAAADLDPFVPSGPVAERTYGTSTAVLLRSSTRERTQRGSVHGRKYFRETNDAPVRSRAEGPLSSRAAPARAQAGTDFKDEDHGDSEFVNKTSSARNSPWEGDGQPPPPTAECFRQRGEDLGYGSEQFEGDLLPLADCGKDPGDPRLPDERGIDTASPTEAMGVNGNSPALLEHLEAQRATQSPTPSSHIDPAVSSPPSLSSPPPPPPYHRSPPQLSTAGGSEIQGNERDKPELVQEEPAPPKAPVDVSVGVDLSTRSPLTSPLARLYSSPLPRSPPALRPEQSAAVGAFQVDKIDDDAHVSTVPSVAWQLRAEWRRCGAVDEGDDSDQGCTTAVRT